MLKRHLSPSASTKAVVAALCLVLVATPLAACSRQQTTGATDSGAATDITQQDAPVDPSSWKTLGDALATQTAPMASSYDENHYVCVFQACNSIVRVVAKMDSESMKKIDIVDWSRDDVDKQIEEAAGGLPIESAEDITGDLVLPEDLAKLAGKTGQDLVDEGWVFSSYSLYGGAQTGATFEKGYFAYSVTFEVSTPESATEDGGASVMGAPIVEAQLEGASNSAVDPAEA